MADDRPLLEKLLNMLAAEEDTIRAVAAGKIAKMAKEANKTVSQLCMTGPTVYVDKVVYRDAAPQRGPVGEQFWEAMRKAAQDNERARRQEREHRRQESSEQAKERYRGAFDDAEMSDEEREAVRARRASDRAKQKARRRLLDELDWAAQENDDDLTAWELEFASTVPGQYYADYDLSPNQKRTAERIINKVKRNKEGSPI